VIATGVQYTEREFATLAFRYAGIELRCEGKAAALGWTYKTELEEGIRLSYKDFLENPMRAER